MILTLCLNPTLQKTLECTSVHKGAVNRIKKQRTDASGKGINVSRVLAQLGMNVTHITQLGGQHKEWFISLIENADERERFQLSYVESESTIRFCYTILEKKTDSAHRATELVEEGDVVSAKTEQAIYNRVIALCNEPSCQALVISGSKARGFSDTIYPRLVLQSIQKGILTIVDFRSDDLRNTLKMLQQQKDMLPHADCANHIKTSLIIKLNQTEFTETFCMENDDFSEKELSEKMKELYITYGCKTIITRGSDSTMAYDGKTAYTINTLAPQSVYNTIGSGDSFAAGFTAAFVQNKSFEEALYEGNCCGSRNAQHMRPADIIGI